MTILQIDVNNAALQEEVEKLWQNNRRPGISKGIGENCMKEQSAPDFGVSLKRLIIFQLKLAADAIRDLLLSPISIVLFIVDIVLKPDRKDSYFEKLMQAGRHSDRIINLFDEYTEKEKYATFDKHDTDSKASETSEANRSD